MGRNVLLLYMSIFNKNPKIQTQTQTNEGAVRYLIEEGETPDCILALCSERVRKEAKEMPDGSTRTTLEYFRDSFLPKVHIPAERLVVIEVPDSMDEETQFQAISQLLEKIETEDTLFVDLSGGLRDVAMLLVIAARCMRDLRKVQTRRVIYAELRGGESIVRDRTQLYGLFDFVTAMDQFFSTGTAQKLEDYLLSEGEKDPVLHTLLTRINQFSEDLALCRVRKLNDDLNQIDQALKETPEKSQNLTDLFFQMLKDRFSTEFAELLSSGEKALPALVNWCAGHGMYQQALTLLLLARHVIVVVHHIESHHLRSVLWTAHHHSQIDQSLGIFRIAHGYEHLLLAFVCRSVFGHFLVTQGYLLRRAFGHYGGDDAREEYHYYHSVEHIVGDERHARLHLHLHAHHHHGNGARSMCRRESEHHIARRYGQAEQPTGEIGSHCLAHRSEHYYHYHYAHYAASGKQQSQIDEHAHTYKKIRYE